MIDKFIADRKSRGLTERTIEYYIENLSYYRNFCEKERIAMLEPESYDKYVIFLLGKDIKRASARTYLRAVKVFLRWCTDMGIIDYGYGLKLPKKHTELIHPLSKSEICRIIESFDDCEILNLRNHCLTALMLDCGLRRTELVNLKLSDVCFDESMIIVNGKGSRQRYVPIGNSVKDLLMKYNSRVFRKGCDSFFINRYNEPITIGAVKSMIQKLKKETGIKRLHCHLFRHTFATLYLLNGGSLPALRLLLGHSDINVTQIYLHLSEYYRIIHNQHISLLDSLT